jgi:hypothetical protein
VQSVVRPWYVVRVADRFTSTRSRRSRLGACLAVVVRPSATLAGGFILRFSLLRSSDARIHHLRPITCLRIPTSPPILTRTRKALWPCPGKPANLRSRFTFHRNDLDEIVGFSYWHHAGAACSRQACPLAHLHRLTDPIRFDSRSSVPASGALALSTSIILFFLLLPSQRTEEAIPENHHGVP